MKNLLIAGIALIVIGAAVLGYDHYSYTTRETVLQVGPIMIDRAAHAVSIGGETLDLTATEYKLLLTLAERRGRVQARAHLLETVWEAAPDIQTRTVDMHVQRLRAKLGDGRHPGSSMSSESTRTPVRAFISYSWRDMKLVDRLEKHLSVLVSEGDLSLFIDRNLDPGSK